MITVKEYGYDDALLCAKTIPTDFTTEDRIFVMKEGDDIKGISVVGLEKGVVIIRETNVQKGLPFGYFDLLARATLNFIRNLNGSLKVRVKKSAYYVPFGFIDAGDNMEIMSDKIVFKGSICGGK